MNEHDYPVLIVTWSKNRDEIEPIRNQVFIIEQNVPVELEWDGLDAEAIHVIAYNRSGMPAGTARLLCTGQVGRMAVLPEERNRGIGSAMLRTLIQHAKTNSIGPLFLHAQTHAIKFYENHGFKQSGGIFYEAGIPHCKMIHVFD